MDSQVKDHWAYGLLYQNGRLLVDSAFKTEEDAWAIGLGWPDEKEIEEEKSFGTKAVWCNVRIIHLRKGRKVMEEQSDLFPMTDGEKIDKLAREVSYLKQNLGTALDEIRQLRAIVNQSGPRKEVLTHAGNGEEAQE